MTNEHVKKSKTRVASTKNCRSRCEDLVADKSEKRLPQVVRACLAASGDQLRMPKAQILNFDRMITAWHRSDKTRKPLDEFPRVAPALATSLVASVANPKAFRSGRDFSAS